MATHSCNTDGLTGVGSRPCASTDPDPEPGLNETSPPLDEPAFPYVQEGSNHPQMHDV